MVIEGAVAGWVLGQVEQGTDWNRIDVLPPDDASDEHVPVLVVPVPSGDAEAARERIEAALTGD